MSDFPSLKWAIKCVDDHDPIPPLYRPRGQAGVACAWHPSIDNFISVLPDGSDRTLAIQVKTTTSSFIIINSYLPCIGTQTKIKYDDITDEVHEIIQKYSHCNSILWVGDMNADMSRSSTKNDIALSKFCVENSLSLASTMPLLPTFHHFNGKSKSRIDLVIHPNQQKSIISNIEIDTRDILNTSSHDAIIIQTLESPPSITQSNCKHNENNNADAPQRIKWQKTNIVKYKTLTENRLSSIMKHTDNDLPVEVIISRVNNILTESAKECCSTPVTPKKARIYRWSSNLKPFITEAKHKYFLWKNVGKPNDKNNQEYINNCKSKKALRKAQRQIAAEDRNQRHQEIMDASEENQSLFFQIIRRQRSDNCCALIKFNFDPNNTNTQANNWAKY